MMKLKMKIKVMMVVFIWFLAGYCAEAGRSRVVTTVTHTTHINHRIESDDAIGDSVTNEQANTLKSGQVIELEAARKEQCADIPTLGLLAEVFMRIPLSTAPSDLLVNFFNYKNSSSGDPPSCLTASLSAQRDLAECGQVVHRKWKSMNNTDSDVLEADALYFTLNLEDKDPSEVTSLWLESSRGSRRVCVGWSHFKGESLTASDEGISLTVVQKFEFETGDSTAAQKTVLPSISILKTKEAPLDKVEDHINSQKIRYQRPKVQIEEKKLHPAVSSPFRVETSFQAASNIAAVTRTVSVDSLVDSAPNISLCSLTVSDRQVASFMSVTSGECNLRSAVETCMLFLSNDSCADVSTVCVVLLPPKQSIFMDPVLGEVIISSDNLCGTLSVEGSGCVVQPSFSIPLSMRLLNVDLPIPSDGWFSLRIDNVIIMNFGNSSVDGGAIRINNFKSNYLSSVTNVIFRSNTGRNGGALAISNSEAMMLGGILFEENTAQGDAGGLFINSGCENINITECSFNYNRAMGEVNSKPDNAGLGGGAMINTRNSLVALTNCSFFKNMALHAGGLGIYSFNDHIYFADVSFLNNTADMFGGGMYAVFDNLYVPLARCYFLGNIGKAETGGLRLHSGNSYMNLLQCNFSGNSARGEGGNGVGGGIYINTYNNYFTLQDCHFSGNSVSNNGGGFGYAVGGGLYINMYNNYFMSQNCHFSGNSVSNNGGGYGVARGGGIYINEGNDYFTLQDCHFSGNSVSGTGGEYLESSGGGISLYMSNFYFLLQNCRVYGNSVTSGEGGGALGGAMFILNTNYYYKILGCHFSGNSVSSGEGGYARGGGVYISGYNYNSITQDCHFSGNSVASGKEGEASGGGVFIRNSDDESMIYCHFSGNSVISGDGGKSAGGGIYMNNGYHYYFTLQNCNFTGSSVSSGEGGEAYGGAVYLDSTINYLTLQDCHFLDNSVSSSEGGGAWGGGVYVFSGNYNLLVQGCHFSGNRVSTTEGGYAWGGGIYMFTGNYYMIVQDCYFKDNSADAGGAIFLDAGNWYATLHNVTCRGNVARDDGGGLALVSGNNYLTINNSFITDNSAGIRGGGIYSALQNNDIELIHSEVSGNSAQSAGGVYIGESHKSVFFEDVDIRQNTALGTAGGIYFARFSSDIILSYCQIRNNSAATVGGLLVLADAISITSSVVESNMAEGDHGALYIQSSKLIEISFCNFSSNVAQGSCGAMSVSETESVTVSDTLFSSNFAETGGAVCVEGDSRNTSFNSIHFQSNTAFASAGALRVANACNVFIEVSSFADNTALRGDGSAIHISSSSVSLASNSFSSNRALLGGGTVFWVSSSGMQEPHGLSEAGNFFSVSNTARYGNWYATEARSIVSKNNIYSLELVDYITQAAPPITVLLRDWYNQTVLSDSSSSITVSASASLVSDCYGEEGFIGGLTRLTLLNGSATFDLLEPVCAPTYNLSLDVVPSLSSVDLLPFQYSFRACVTGEYYAERICNPCKEGSYSFAEPSTLPLSDLNSDVCQQCPSGAQICLKDQIFVEKGHWRRFARSSAVLTCPLPHSCIGGNETGNGLCALGYEGPLCNICSFDYFQSETECLQCSSRSSKFTPSFFIYVIFFSFSMMFWSYHNYLTYKTLKLGEDANKYFMLKLVEWLRQKKNKILVRLKIIVTTFQVISAMSDTLVVSMPKSFSTFANILGFLNLNIMNAFNVDCYRKTNFIDSLLLNTLMPIAACAVLAFCFGCELIYQQKQKYFPSKRKIEVKDEQRNSKIFSDLMDKYLNLFFYLTYFVLPGVSTQIFQMFVCTNVDPESEDNASTDSFLTADMSISCESEYYRSGLIYACFMVVVYPIGIPLMYGVLLYRNRHYLFQRIADTAPPMTSLDISNPLLFNKNNRSVEKKNSTPEDVPIKRKDSETNLPDSVKRLQFLWGSYKPQLYYWEIVETYRRLALTAILSVCGTGTSKQAVLSVVLSIFFIKLYNWKSPYLDMPANILAEVGMFQIFFSFFAALCIQNSLLPDWDVFLGAFLICMNFGVIYLSLYFQYKAQKNWVKLDTNIDVEMVLMCKNRGNDNDINSIDSENTTRVIGCVGYLSPPDDTLQTKPPKV